ncbi:MAG: glycosyltransferase family 1 protein, partial [Azospirillaceae bacterium]
PPMAVRQAPPPNPRSARESVPGNAPDAAAPARAPHPAPHPAPPPGRHVLFDVTTCHYNRGRVMTGIPRVELNLAAAIAEALGDAVTFLRYDAKSGQPVIEPAATVLTWGREAPTEKLGRSETGIFARSRLLAAIASRHSPVRRLGRTLERGVRRGRRRLASALDATAKRPAAAGGTASPLGERLAKLANRDLVFVHFGADWLAADLLAKIQETAARPVETRVLVHDLLPLDFPEFYPVEFRKRFADYVTDFVLPADRLFAYSEYTRGRLSERAGIAAERVIRVHLPTDMSALMDTAPEPVASIAEQDEPFFLTVGVVCKRKNQAFLVDVWEAVLKQGEKLPLLVIAGSLRSAGDAYAMRLYRRVQATQLLRDNVHFVENAPDRQLMWLYSNCIGFLFPSLAEGWGLPITEAISMGVPCITSDRTAVPEAGDGKARVLPMELERWSSEVRNFANQRLTLNVPEADLSHDKPFTWQKLAAELLQPHRLTKL